MIAGSGDSLDYTQAVSLNDSAAFLIEEVRDRDFTAEDWVTLLTERYDVDQERARQDIDQLIEMLRQAEVID